MDDEPLVLEQLRTYLARVPFLQVVATCHDAYEAIETMKSVQVDAIFTDINMPDLNGLEFVRSLEEPPIVVFTTAYPDYAIEGYKVSAVDYVLKPFSFDDILSAAKKVKQRYELLTAQRSAPAEEGYVYVRAEHRQVRVAIADIDYVEGRNEYVCLHLHSGESIVTFLSMRKMVMTLPEPQYMRVHRSFIINMSRLRSVSRSSITMTDGTQIPIGESYKEKIVAHVMGRTLDR